MTSKKKLISIVIPAYNEEDCVEELAAQLTNVMNKLKMYKFEVLIVENDGNTNETFNIKNNGKWVTTSLDAGAVATFVW